MINLADDAMTIKLDYELPEYPKFEEGYRRAPRRESHLTEADKALAIKNALRYIHPDHHEQMAKEFAQELEEHGRIYGYRFRPEGKLYGKPIDEYKGKCIEGKAIQVMIDNNLDFDIALYPYELVTYGETGQVCQNWMQYRLIKKYLEQLTERGYQKRTVAFIENGSWAPTAARNMAKMFENSKDIEQVGTVTIRSAMTDENKAQLDALAKELA